jgi:hypothetical protein
VLNPLIAALVRKDFPATEVRAVRRELRALRKSLGTEADTRLMAAVLVSAQGDRDRLRSAIRGAETDWRDVLYSSRLADHDGRGRLWRVLLLGSAAAPPRG